MMVIRQWHWAVAFVIACALHLGLAVMMILESVDPPARGIGKGGLEIQLTRSGSRPAESAHTRTNVREAARRAASEAAPLISADRAEKAVVPETVSRQVSPDAAREASRPDVAVSPVPESADVTAPASAPQPESLPDASVPAAPVAETAAVANQASPIAIPEEAKATDAQAAAAVADTSAAEEVTAAPVETRSAENAVTAQPADTVTAQPADTVTALPAGSDDGPTGDVPPPDALPPLEQVSDVAPASASSVTTALAPDAVVARAVAPAAPVEQADRQLIEAVGTPDIPLATATDPGVEEAPAAASRVPVAPSSGDVPVTRAGDDVTNAGSVGPDETAKAIATGRNDEVTDRSGDGLGDDRRDSQGGKGGDKNRYISLVKQWIQMHRNYPDEAREAGQEGVALVYVKVNREGVVTEYRILQSTGYPLLDAEIVAAVERSLPLPEIPDTVENAPLKLILPVSFALNR